METIEHDDYDDDIDMQNTENLTNIFGVNVKNGRLKATGSRYCNTCNLSNLFTEDQYMANCECCKGWGHLFKCWAVDINVRDKDSYMKKLKTKSVKYYCPDCTNVCRNKKDDKGNKIHKNCNKYKSDELYNIELISRDELIKYLHEEWNKMLNTLITAFDMWSYDPDRQEIMMEMKKCLDFRIILLIINKIASGNNTEKWNKILKNWGIKSLSKVCSFIKNKWPQKRINMKEINKAYATMKDKLKQMNVDGLLEKSYQCFRKHWRVITKYKGHWTIEQECERLFFSKEALYDGCQPYLRIYDIVASFDCIEAKMETIGKHCKHLLINKPNLDDSQFDWELILKDNLGKLGDDEKFVDRLVNLFLQFKKNRSPLIPKHKRKTKVSQVIDRHLGYNEEQQLIEDEIIKLLNNLFLTKKN